MASYSPGPYTKRIFHAKLAERGCDNQTAALLLDRLEPVFGPADLDLAIASVHSDLLSRAAVRDAVAGHPLGGSQQLHGRVPN